MSTSAEPDFEVIERLPCFATFTPAPATTKVAVVLILKVPFASPPVPHMSIASELVGTLTIFFRIASANPVISSTVSPFPLSAIKNPAICASLNSPDIMESIILFA